MTLTIFTPNQIVGVKRVIHPVEGNSGLHQHDTIVKSDPGHEGITKLLDASVHCEDGGSTVLSLCTFITRLVLSAHRLHCATRLTQGSVAVRRRGRL